ncbi:hypothetical protein QR680_000532 [Steinernema hermaphroditum]|uniref:Uncharacterized protein n=1 Tax=Steinernema hermaphroditum TaxID=289476 RepID=A0AA39LE91_9BILA|nr:hypothetical protein QR680_000532 [Steinernema hermaphroditum]
MMIRFKALPILTHQQIGFRVPVGSLILPFLLAGLRRRSLAQRSASISFVFRPSVQILLTRMSSKSAVALLALLCVASFMHCEGMRLCGAQLTALLIRGCTYYGEEWPCFKGVSMPDDDDDDDDDAAPLSKWETYRAKANSFVTVRTEVSQCCTEKGCDIRTITSKCCFTPECLSRCYPESKFEVAGDRVVSSKWATMSAEDSVKWNEKHALHNLKSEFPH